MRHEPAQRGKKGSTPRVPPFNIPSIEDLGITKKESARAQVLAELPTKEKGEVVEGTITPTQAARDFRKLNNTTRNCYELVPFFPDPPRAWA